MAKKNIDSIKLQIKELLNSNQAQLDEGIVEILKLNQTPRDSILEYINQPNIKLSKVESMLKLICPHVSNIRSGDSTACADCGLRLGGWWCDKSPDNSCYYCSEPKDGLRIVELRKGSEVVLPQSHDPQYETDDCCLFCGQPEERK